MEDKEVIRNCHNDFTKVKLSLTNLVAHEGVSASLERGTAMDVIYLDFCKNFDAVHLNVPIFKLKTYGFDGMCWLIILHSS